MLNRLKALLTPQRLPAVDGPDYRPLAQHPHFKTYVTLEPHIPEDGPEAIRSWFGGKPQMPADTAWPKDDGGRPCLFLAQICCADLPPDLWGGVGPIDGWLLFFIAAQAFEPRVIHIAQLGPERHEESGVARTYWEWNTRAGHENGTPRFRKFPVRPVAQTMPSDLALPKREQPKAPPLRPRTWGQLDTILTSLEEEFAPPKPLTPEQEEINRINREKMQADFDMEPEDRRRRRAEAFEKSEKAGAAFRAAKAEVFEALRLWLSKSMSHGPDEMLTDADWADFAKWAEHVKRPSLKREVIAPEVRPGVEKLEAPYCLWWHPFSTKAEFQAQVMAVAGYASKHEFSGNDTIKKRLQADNAAYGGAVINMLQLVDSLKDSDRIDTKQKQAFLDKSRSNVQCAQWFGETIGRRLLPIVENSLAYDAPLVSGLVAEGLTPTKQTKTLYTAMGQSQLDGYLAGTLPPDAVSQARAYAEHVHKPGRTMGGLPFFGHDPNVMDLQAYASPKQRAALDDPMSRAVYGDIERMEPQCLLLNLGSHDPVGWLWGDCYTLTIHMPRADLEAGRFDRVTGYIDNG